MKKKAALLSLICCCIVWLAEGAVFDCQTQEKITIDWDSPLKELNPLLFSLNSYNSFDPKNVDLNAWKDGISYMSPKALRLHNSRLFKKWYSEEENDWDWHKIEVALTSTALSKDTILVINIPSWPNSYDVDNDGRLDDDKVENYAKLCASLVGFINNKLKIDVNYWEITNEKDYIYLVGREDSRSKVNSAGVKDMAAILNAAALEIHKVSPKAKVGGPSARTPEHAASLVELAKLTYKNIDFVSFHAYATGGAGKTDEEIYKNVNKIQQQAQELINEIRDAVPEKKLEFHLNEYNMSSNWRHPESRMKANSGAMFDAYMIIKLTELDGLTMANAWDDMDGIFGKMNWKGELRAAAHTYHFFNNVFSGNIVNVGNDSKDLAVLATVDSVKKSKAIALVNIGQKKLLLKIDQLSNKCDQCLWDITLIPERGHLKQWRQTISSNEELKIDGKSVYFLSLGSPN